LSSDKITIIVPHGYPEVVLQGAEAVTVVFTNFRLWPLVILSCCFSKYKLPAALPQSVKHRRI